MCLWPCSTAPGPILTTGEISGWGRAGLGAGLLRLLSSCSSLCWLPDLNTKCLLKSFGKPRHVSAFTKVGSLRLGESSLFIWEKLKELGLEVFFVLCIDVPLNMSASQCR